MILVDTSDRLKWAELRQHANAQLHRMSQFLERQLHRAAARRQGLVDSQTKLVRLEGVRHTAMRLDIIADTIDEVIDLGIKRMMMYISRVGCNGGKCCPVALTGQQLGGPEAIVTCGNCSRILIHADKLEPPAGS